MLNHERLDVYQCALEFCDIASPIVENPPGRFTELADQLKRACVSMVLNIAEACGQKHNGNKENFYGYSRGSTLECGAAFDLLYTFGKLDEPAYERGKKLLTRVGAMLTKLCGF